MPKRRSDTNLLVPWEVVVIMSSQQDLSLKYFDCIWLSAKLLDKNRMVPKWLVFFFILLSSCCPCVISSLSLDTKESCMFVLCWFENGNTTSCHSLQLLKKLLFLPFRFPNCSGKSCQCSWKPNWHCRWESQHRYRTMSKHVGQRPKAV